MKLLITGSRTFNDENLLFKKFESIKFTNLISGGASGADEIAERYCRLNNIPITVFKPDYKSYGRAAPIIRNKQMVELCDSAIAFWNGESKGTKFTIDYCKKKNKSIIIISF